MKKGTVVGLIALIVLFFLGGLFVGINMTTNKTATGEIVGRAYIDTNWNVGLDFKDTPANELVVVLNKLGELGKGGREYIKIAEATVDENGEYRFADVPEGEYAVTILFVHSKIYKLEYNSCTYVPGNNQVEVKKGKTSQGPTILLCRGGLG